MNPLTIFEIILGLLVFIMFLTFIDFPLYTDIKSYVFEDLYASLTSLQYINYTENDVCNIISKIYPLFVVYINDTLACNTTLEYTRGIKFIEIRNGSVTNITVYIK